MTKWHQSLSVHNYDIIYEEENDNDNNNNNKAQDMTPVSWVPLLKLSDVFPSWKGGLSPTTWLEAHTSLGLSRVSVGPDDVSKSSSCLVTLVCEAVAGVAGCRTCKDPPPDGHPGELSSLSLCKSQEVNCCHWDERLLSSDLPNTKNFSTILYLMSIPILFFKIEKDISTLFSEFLMLLVT